MSRGPRNTRLLIDGKSYSMPAPVAQRLIQLEQALSPFAEAGRDMPAEVNDKARVAVVARTTPPGTAHFLWAHQLRYAAAAFFTGSGK